MHDLCVVQQEVSYPYHGPYLRISPLPEGHALPDGQLEFRYIDTHISDRQWSRIVPSSAAFARLEKFLDQLHWFAKEEAEPTLARDARRNARA
jgi:hypothetical protein